MKIRINHGEMTIVKNKLNNESTMLLEEIKKIEKSIEELKTTWQGEEADVFYAKINNYLTKLKTVPSTYNNLSNYLEKTNIRYKEADLELKKALENVRVNG